MSFRTYERNRINALSVELSVLVHLEHDEPVLESLGSVAELLVEHHAVEAE